MKTRPNQNASKVWISKGKHFLFSGVFQRQTHTTYNIVCFFHKFPWWSTRQRLQLSTLAGQHGISILGLSNLEKSLAIILSLQGWSIANKCTGATHAENV